MSSVPTVPQQPSVNDPESTIQPSVTAVVPTHNRPKLMQRAVRSILNQAYEGEIEVIVVFDACEPFTPTVEIPHRRRLRIMSNERSRGLAGSRNTGIDAASHQFVAFLDDDDYWLPDKLKMQMPRFNDAVAPILVGSSMVVDNGQRTFERLAPKEVVGYEDLLRDRIAALHSSTFVFRREALREIGAVDEDLPKGYGEDYDLLLRSAQAAPIVVVNEPLVTVMWAGQSYYFGQWGAYADGLEYLLRRHPAFASNGPAMGRLCGQIAFARAAHGQRREALRWARRSLRRDPRQLRSWLALGIAARVLSAPWVFSRIQKVGKGI